MNFRNAPQPIPYQGSKRQQVPVILGCLPKDVATLWEPFVGSGAVTIGAAAKCAAQAHVVGDSLEPLIGIWDLMLHCPDELCDRYEILWNAQLDDPRAYYDRVRDEFNEEKDPAKLLYLIARCVKNAVRFNAEGSFNQSPDKRRLGMRPALLRERVRQVNALLAGKATARAGDYSAALEAARPRDVVYMDPPYMGVSKARDSRYHQGLDYDRFVGLLAAANDRGVSYLVSFDGRCGTRSYGPGLPDDLELKKIEVHVGRSSQATLNGRSDETVESLYLSPALTRRLAASPVAQAKSISVRSPPQSSQLAVFDGR
ncbi:MAG: DNA adenine methylase [Myxococcales bacterium]|nr:DNA adenine methylase [Myxococcales bacterium]